MHYHLLNVFARSRFGGNPLAVITHAEGLNTEQMQAIAQEFNLSETVFFLPPLQPNHHARVRIFTPKTELPFAGHPTIGAAWLWSILHYTSHNYPDTIFLEEGIGTIEVALTATEGKLHLATLTAPPAQFGEIFAEAAVMASVLGIEADDLHTHLPIQCVSCGVPFWFVPVRTLAAVQQIRLNTAAWQQHIAPLDCTSVYVFTTETVEPTSAVHGRMFDPAFGISEDPATGSANAPLMAYMTQYHLLNLTDGQEIVSEQGFEMHRPSHLHLSITHTHEGIQRVRVGGAVIHVGEGDIWGVI